MTTEATRWIGRTFYDIAQAPRVGRRRRRAGAARALELLRDLVPYEQCAVLEARLGHEPQVVMVPETLPDERALLTGTLLGIFGQLVDANGAYGRAGCAARAERTSPCRSSGSTR